MILKLKGTTNAPVMYVKSIIFRLNDGTTLEVSRNRSEYVIDDGYFKMSWKGCFIEGPKGHDFTIPAKIFRDATISDITFNNDAPRKLEFRIDSWTAVDP